MNLFFDISGLRVKGLKKQKTILCYFALVFVRFIATPLVRYLGVKDKPTVFVPNTFCEKVYQTISKSPNAERVEGLSKQLGWTTREVKRWFKNRRQQSKSSLLRKATESRYKNLMWFEPRSHFCMFQGWCILLLL